MAAIAPGFRDPETESAFLSAEREKRGGDPRPDRHRGRALLGYIVINPLHFPPRA